jgi:ubiquinone/menaquinone biosynthesis C-methylase UbiE
MDGLYNSKNPLVRFLHRKRLSTIACCVPRRNGLRVLDAGCGEGHLLELLQGMHPANEYCGVDVIDVALRRARGRCPFARFNSMDVCHMSFEDSTFDVVILTQVIEHIYGFENALSECMRILKPGGLFLISFPNEPLWTVCRFLMGRTPAKVPDHVNAFTPSAMRRYLSMKPLQQKHLPCSLPFPFSLVCVMVFRKEA